MCFFNEASVERELSQKRSLVQSWSDKLIIGSKILFNLYKRRCYLVFFSKDPLKLRTVVGKMCQIVLSENSVITK